MPTPVLPISIKVKNTNLSAGEYVKVTNFTSGGTVRGKVSSNGEVSFEPNDLGHTWSNSDVIQIESLGRIPFVSYTTISKNASKTTSTASTSDTTTPAVDM